MIRKQYIYGIIFYLTIQFSYSLQTEIPFQRDMSKEERDSVYNVLRKKQRLRNITSYKEKAQVRTERYKNNTRKDTVTYLDLSYNDLSQLPEYVPAFKNIKRIDLGHNNIKHLGKFLNHFDSLEQISLASNKIYRGKIKVAKNKTVKTVFLYDNNLHKLPRFIRKFKALEEISISKN
ncbi:MAG: hypothetical protein OEX22_02560, partial [Cyclobacteriaceae bacterium]|nr:hypothetical protein [Cyclobacteriaceae bacterium]